jgi:hypothetical protein
MSTISVRLYKKIFQKDPTLWKNVLTEIDKNDLEESRATVTASCYSSCYYCDYKSDSKDDYERHVIMKHGHSLAYPNKAEIEKMGLKAWGKSWEI